MIIILIIVIPVIIYLILDYHGPKNISLRPGNAFGFDCLKAKDLIIQEYDANGNLWATRGMILYQLKEGDNKFYKISHLPSGFSFYWLNNFRIIRRLTLNSESIETTITKDGQIIALSAGYMWYSSKDRNKFKKTLVQLSDSILFKPLGMKDTRYCFDKDMDTTLYAIPHDAQGNKIEISIRDRGVNAAALLLTTIEDYSKFMVYVMNGAGLSPSLYNDMIRSQAAERKHVGRGLGWEIVSDLSNGEYTLQHGGSNAGVKTMCIILPKSKRGVVVFTNSDNGMTVYNNVIREALDEGQQILDSTNGFINYTTIKLSNEILEQYIGTYARSDLNGWKINITKEVDILKVSGESLPVMEFVPYAEDKFFVKGYGFQYEFIKNEANKVIQLNISENEKLLLTAKKIK